MTDEEVMISGPAIEVSCSRQAGAYSIYNYFQIMVRHPAGWRSVNHAQSPTSVTQCQVLAKRLFPDLPFNAGAK